MKIKLIGNDKAILTPTGGKIKDILNNRLYSEVTVKPSNIWRYTDADSVTYEEVDVDILPEEIRTVFDQVVNMIVQTAVSYNALEDLKNLPNFNIASLFGLADAKGVSDQELQQIIMQVVMLKTDIEAKLPRSWYDVWNGNLKPYIIEQITALKKAM